jgi:magnesium-transporting ATPase (P-type)
MSVLVKSP